MHSNSSVATRFSEDAEELAAAPEIPALTILCHPDIRRVGERSPLHGLRSQEAVELSRHHPLFAVPRGGTPRGLGVSYVSRKPLRLTAGRMVERPEIGAEVDFLLKRCGSATPVKVEGQLLDEHRQITHAEVQRGVVFELGRRVVLLFHLCPSISNEAPRFGLVGESGAMHRLRDDIVCAARVEVPVLLRGASGTGKELVARAVHDAGPRRDRPWVAVNMAAIPPTLAAAELFGSQKGAFTGADRSKDGFFLAADGGTLFLDEIGDTPPEVQPLLLRVLESGEIQPVGSAQSRRVDVRVLTATDADLEARIADGSFRAPLLHRLAGFEIRLPPLTARRDDIGRLLVHFLARELGGIEPLLTAADPAEERPWPPASLVARLAAYDWPGNVRQLVNVARRLAISRRAERPIDLGLFVESLLTDGGVAPSSKPIVVEPPLVEPPKGQPVSPTGKWRPVYRKASEVSEEELVDALRGADFELTPAAEALGVSRSVLYRLIERCSEVRKAADFGREEIEQALARGGDEVAAARFLQVSLQGLRLRMKALGLR